MSAKQPPEPAWQEYWLDMPEFVQEGQKPYAKIIFRCETEEALDDLAKRIGQKLTGKTKSVWHPQKERGADTRGRAWRSDK